MGVFVGFGDRMRVRVSAVVVAAVVAIGLCAVVVAPVLPVLPVASAADGSGGLGAPSLASTAQVGGSGVEGLQYAEPTAGLVGVGAPSVSQDGSARTAYGFALPAGRSPASTPSLGLAYDSAGAGGSAGWVGQGWSLSGVGEVRVDTEFGVPLFCPRTVDPVCGDVESESYRLDGERLAPGAVGGRMQQRVADRADFTRVVETSYDQIIRHGDSPDEYSWEVRDRAGNVSFYGAHPDGGGTVDSSGTPGSRTGAERNDATIAGSAIAADDAGNGVVWFLKARRDVGANLVRYEYDTVHYQGVPSSEPGQPMVWREVAASACVSGAGATCARHTYLASIHYSGSAAGAGESAGYVVSLVRGAQRPDPVLDARGGYLDLDRDLLTRVEVRLAADATPTDQSDSLVAAYRLGYTAGVFGKTRLTAVTQLGCATGAACDPAAAASTRFDYFDEAGEQGGFAKEVDWDTGDDSYAVPEAGYESAVGMSSSEGGSGRVYVGFNPAVPSKMGSFGGSVTMDGTTTKGVVDLVDINGDGLVDKVYLEGSSVKYRLNTSRPTDAADKRVSFSAEEGVVAGITELGLERQVGISGSLEAHYGADGIFTAGGSWTYGESYFTDANADGLPDFVNAGSVYFNHLDCSGAGCVPRFTRDSAGTRVPVRVSSPAGVESAGAMVNGWVADQVMQLREAVPPVDTVRRWVAPYAGTVQITSTATLLTGTAGTGGAGGAAAGCPEVGVGSTDTDAALVRVQVEADEIAVCALTAGQPRAVNRSVRVERGEWVYFRFSPASLSSAQEVSWSQRIDYLTADGTADLAALPTDPEGRSTTSFSWSDAFSASGRPAMVGLPDVAAGEVAELSGVLSKDRTSDDLTFTVLRHPLPGTTDDTTDTAPAPMPVAVSVVPVTAAGGVDATRQREVVERETAGDRWCVQTPGGVLGCEATETAARAAASSRLYAVETGQFRVTARHSTVGAGAGMLEARLATTSVVDPAAVVWVRSPGLCVRAAAGDACGVQRVPVQVPVELFPVNTATHPRRAQDRLTVPEGTGTRAYEVSVDLPTGSSSAGVELVGDQRELWLTLKGSDGSLVKTSWLRSRSDQGGSLEPRRLQLTAGVSYWVDVTARHSALYATVRGLRAFAHPVGDTGPDTELAVRVNGPGWGVEQGHLGVGNQGWGVAGYRADGTRRAAPLRRSDFDLAPPGGFGDGKTGEAKACASVLGADRCQADARVPEGPPGFTQNPSTPGGGLPGTGRDAPAAYLFLPRLVDAPTGAGALSWVGPRDAVNTTATTMGAARLTEVPEPLTPAPNQSGSGAGGGYGDLAAPVRLGQVAPHLGAAGGVGPLSASASVGWSSATVGYLDLNGDRFPDLVMPGLVAYTNPRGGSSCPRDGGGYGPCAVRDTVAAGQLGSQFSVATAVGLNGSVASIEANSAGQSNVTKGQSAGRGGESSDSSYGGKLGISGGAGFSGSWSAPLAFAPTADGWGGADLGFVPGGTPLDDLGVVQRNLADVNGDGLPDQVKVDGRGLGVRFNTGYGFTGQWLPWAAQIGFESGESYGGTVNGGASFATPAYEFSGGLSRTAKVDFARYTWTDVNGDGILDGLYRDGEGTAARVLVRFGTGLGLSAPRVYGTTGEKTFDFVNGWDAAKISTGQQVRQDTSVGWSAGADFTVSVPLCAPIPACYLVINPGGHGGGSVTVTDVDLRDVNGDGYPDSVSRGTGDASMNVRLNTHGKTGLLKSVTTPLGGSYTLDYTRAGNTTDHPGSVWTMTKLTVDDGYAADGPAQTSTFAYDQLRYDFVHRTSLGFATVTTRELATEGPNAGEALRTTLESYANQHLWEAGLLTRTEVHDGDPGQGTLQAATETTWTVLGGATQEPVDAAGLAAMDPDELLTVWARPLPVEQSSTRVVDGRSQTSRTETSYDRFGTPVTERDLGDPATSTDDVTTLTTYATCASSASTVLRSECVLSGNAAQRSPFATAETCPTWVRLPASVTVLDDQGRVLRDVEAPENLCGLGVPTRIAERTGPGAQNQTDPGGGSTGSGTGWAVTRVALDAWGNPARVVHPPGGNGRYYAQTNTYDPATHTVAVGSADYDLTPAQAEAFLSVGTIPTTDPAARGVSASAVYDARTQRVTSRTDINGATTQSRYDALGRTTLVLLPDGKQLAYRYAPASGDGGSGGVRPYATVRNHDLYTHTVTDGLGRVIQTHTQTEVGTSTGTQVGFTVSGAVEYDALGRPAREWQPTYIPATGGPGGGLSGVPVLSAVRATTDPAVSRYNALDEPVEHTDHNGAVTSWTRTIGADQNSGLTLLSTVVTDPEGRGSATGTDARGQVRVNTDLPVGGPAVVTRYDLDGVGQLRRVTQGGAGPGVPTQGGPDRGVVQQSNAYDLQGRRIATTSTDGGRVEFGYDTFGNLISRQSPNQRATGAGVATSYTHAFGGQLRAVDYPDATPDVRYEYGGYGGASAAGNTAGRVSRVVDGAKDQRLTYDAYGQVAAETTTLRHPKWGLGAVTTQYRRDWLGRLLSVTLPGGESVAYGYDGGGRLASVTGTLNGEATRYLSSRRYDPLGAVTAQTYGNGVTTSTHWDPATRWLTRQTSTGPDDAGRPGAGIRLADLTYTYDRAGNVLSYRNDITAAAGGPSRQSFTLDGSYRITHGTGDWDYAAGKRRSYTTRLDYDPTTANLLGKTQRDWDWTPGCTGTKCKDEVRTATSYTLTPTAYPTSGTGQPGQIQGQHQRTGHNGEPVTHDANGNITSIALASDPSDKTVRKLTWDAENRLTSIVDAPSGTGGATTHNTYDHTGTLTVEDTGSPTFYLNPWVTYTNRTLTTHVHADGQRLAARTGPALTWLHHDGVGNTHLTTDADGQVTQRHEYFPNGETWLAQTSDTTTSYGFAGEHTDTTHHISDFGQRWYDPTHQLFYTPDPAPTEDPHTLIDDPQLTGTYTLNHHNSYRYTDPDGRDPILRGNLYYMGKFDPAPAILADTAPIPLMLGVEPDSDVGSASQERTGERATSTTTTTTSTTTTGIDGDDTFIGINGDESSAGRPENWVPSWWVGGYGRLFGTAGFRGEFWWKLASFEPQMTVVANWANQLQMPTQGLQSAHLMNALNSFFDAQPPGHFEEYARLDAARELAHDADQQ